MKGSAVLKWTEKISGPGLWAIAMVFGSCFLVVGFLSVNMLTAGGWKEISQLRLALQVLHLIALAIGFAVLIWGFWGGVASAAGACLVTFISSVIAGHISKYSIERTPYFMECILFIVLSYLTIQFLQREVVEETTDRRQLDRLEADFLGMAIEFGKKEDLMKILLKKQERILYLEGMAGRLQAGGKSLDELVQMCLGDLVQLMGKGEVEITIYSGPGLVRYSRGAAPVENGEGLDEIDKWLEEHRTALLVNNLTHDIRFTPGFGKTRQIMSLVAVPLVWEGGLKGTLRLTSVQPQAFSHEDLRLVSEASALLVPILFAKS